MKEIIPQVVMALVDESATPPSKDRATDSGIDLYAFGDYVIEPHSFKIIRTGAMIDLQDYNMGLIKPKSGSDFLVGAGVVDSGYQGELLVKVFNTSKKDLIIRDGNPVAQLVVLICPKYEITMVKPQIIKENQTDRGEDGGILRQAKTVNYKDVYKTKLTAEMQLIDIEDE